MLFLHCRNCESLAIVVVAGHFDPHLAGRHLAAIERELTIVFVVSSSGLSYRFSKTTFSLILQIS